MNGKLPINFFSLTVLAFAIDLLSGQEVLNLGELGDRALFLEVPGYKNADFISGCDLESANGIGDFNGDGIPDFMFGDPYENVFNILGAGEVYLVFGKENFPRQVNLGNGFDGVTVKGSAAYKGLGSRLDVIGDFNGDLAPDALILAEDLHLHPTSAPAVMILYGPDAWRPRAFRRGDVNADTQTDVTDAIVHLGYQFLGIPSRLDCSKSGDIDDSGRLDLSDAILLLEHLFLGGAGPVPPSATCGRDATADRLSCLAYEPCDNR